MTNKMNNESKYNLVNNENSFVTNYDVSMKTTYFELYLGPAGELGIVGAKDNNYIAWCSFTHIDDSENNKHIFDYVANTDFENFTSLYRVISSEKFDEMKSWYKCRITKNDFDPNVCWNTPFGVRYGCDTENHGSYFSSGITRLYNDLVKKSDFRNISSLYLDILCSYYSQLSSELDDFNMDGDTSHYYSIKHIISIVEDESYMCLCQDASVRKKYLDCVELCSSLYNNYMTIAR